MTDTIKLNCLAWLEIPYFIGVDYESTFNANYRHDITVELKIKLRNDLIRVSTYNRWTFSRDERLNYSQPLTEAVRIPRYVTETEIPYIRDLVKNNNIPYLHIDELETVVELSFDIEVPTQIYESAKQGDNFIPLFPSIGFFNEIVLPKIDSIVDTYRVATLPAIRYTVHPVSESLIDTAFMQIQDPTGKILQQWTHGFDIRGHNRSMQPHVENFGVQSRFESLLSIHENIEYELQFCSSYYLFHMRRWAEAVTIASGVVDSLVREAVFNRLNPEIANILWSKHRNQFKDLFNKILPALGYEKLEEIDGTLWASFSAAKDYRGAAAHGRTSSPFDKNQENNILKYLKALYGVSRWLSLQIDRPWALDIREDGELLPFF